MADYLERLKAKQAENKEGKVTIEIEDLNSLISSAVQACIASALGEGGAIETWADGRYEAKASNG